MSEPLTIDLPTPAIIAHRGASACAPENTLAAFKLALKQEADAIELDARLTADGHVVVLHDPTVDRTTPFQGRVKDLTLADIRKMDAGSHFDIAFRGEPIPTLEEVFKAVGQLAYVDVELTDYFSLADALPDKVARLVRKLKLTRRVLFTSFNPVALLRIRRRLPDCSTGLLALRGTKGWLSRGWLGRLISSYSYLVPEYHDVTPALVRNVHRRGQKILVYVVNEEDEMRRLFELGVDGIITNDPLRARQVLHSTPTPQRNAQPPG